MTVQRYSITSWKGYPYLVIAGIAGLVSSGAAIGIAASSIGSTGIGMLLSSAFITVAAIPLLLYNAIQIRKLNSNSNFYSKEGAFLVGRLLWVLTPSVALPWAAQLSSVFASLGIYLQIAAGISTILTALVYGGYELYKKRKQSQNQQAKCVAKYPEKKDANLDDTPSEADAPIRIARSNDEGSSFNLASTVQAKGVDELDTETAPSKAEGGAAQGEEKAAEESGSDEPLFSQPVAEAPAAKSFAETVSTISPVFSMCTDSPKTANKKCLEGLSFDDGCEHSNSKAQETATCSISDDSGESKDDNGGPNIERGTKKKVLSLDKLITKIKSILQEKGYTYALERFQKLVKDNPIQTITPDALTDWSKKQSWGTNRCRYNSWRGRNNFKPVRKTDLNDLEVCDENGTIQFSTLIKQYNKSIGLGSSKYNECHEEQMCAAVNDRKHQRSREALDAKLEGYFVPSCLG